MKKLLAVLLVFALFVPFTGCGEKEEKKSGGSSAVEKYVESGSMTDCEFKLGDNYTAVLSAVEAAAPQPESEDDHPEFSAYEDDNYKIIETVTYKYYFNPADDKLVLIAAFGDAYGFNHGSIINEVKDAMAENGYEAEEKTLSEQDAFFLYGIGKRSVLEYVFGNNKVMFIFEENALCATALTVK